jgi:hypothetical protein
MLKRTGHWWNRKRIWYFSSEEQNRQTTALSLAPLISVTIAAMSLLVTGLISFQAFKVNERTFLLGHQPRIQIKNSSVEWTSDGAFRVRPTLFNTGDTEAMDVRSTVTTKENSQIIKF